MKQFVPGGCPSFGFLLNKQAIGCPTFRGFRKVGTTNLNLTLIRHSPTAGHLCYTGRMAQRLHGNLESWTNGKFTNIDECLPKNRGAFRLRCDYQAVTVRWTIAPPASCHPEARSLLRRIYATSRPKSAVPQISTAHPPNFVTSDLALHSSNVRSSPRRMG